MFISESIKTDVITVTPRLAKQLLNQNRKNRTLSATDLAKIKESMVRGEWELNGEAIKIAKDGCILDGQHRLIASAETDTTFETLIVYGLENETQETMDTGKPRTVANILSMRGYTKTNILAAFVTAVIRSERWGIRGAVASGNNRLTVTPKQVTDRLTEEPELVNVTHIVRPVAKIGLTGKVAGLLYYEFSKISHEDTEYFFNKLASGEALERGNPILTLRNTLIAIKSDSAARALDQAYIAALAIKAWNKYRAGQQLSRLSFRMGGANPESFPEPI